MLKDECGLALSGSDQEALVLFESALDSVYSFHGNPIKDLKEASGLDPEMASTHLLAAWIFSLSLHAPFQKPALNSLAKLKDLEGSLTPREALHVQALQQWHEGDLRGTSLVFDQLLDEYPLDRMALMFAHQADLFADNGDRLLKRPISVMNHYEPHSRYYHYVMSMCAFGYEEKGDYVKARELAQRAVESNPHDTWGIHAMGHVFEMQGLNKEGIDWYEQSEQNWSEDCFFAVHNWWHLALYHLDELDFDQTLRVYQKGLRPDNKSISLNLCDALALLWRLRINDMDCQDDIKHVAGLFQTCSTNSSHIFSDVHALTAFAAAQQWKEFDALEASLRHKADTGYDPGRMAALVGIPFAKAIRAFEQGDYESAFKELSAIMPYEHLMTGSHAQRDLIALTFVEAGLRSTRHNDLNAFIKNRFQAKPQSPYWQRKSSQG